MSNILCVITKPPKMLMKETNAAAAASACTLREVEVCEGGVLDGDERCKRGVKWNLRGV